MVTNDNGPCPVQNLHRIGYELRKVCRLVKSSEPENLYKNEQHMIKSLEYINDEIKEVINSVQENDDRTENLLVECLKLIEYKLKDILEKVYG